VRIEILLTAIRGKKRVELGRVPLEVDAHIRTFSAAVYLTFRQEQVRDKMLAGKVHKEIAADLHLSLSMVKQYAGQLYKKYRVKDREALLRKLGRGRVANQ
jgi:DNA-binding NarL/FixJ family response regulator